MTNKTRVPVPEKSFATFVEDNFELFNWKWYHVTRTDVRDKAGFPDYVAVRGRRVLFIEIKGVNARGDKGRVSKEQVAWHMALEGDWIPKYDECQATHVEVFVWWPEDSDRILKVLR